MTIPDKARSEPEPPAAPETSGNDPPPPEPELAQGVGVRKLATVLAALAAFSESLIDELEPAPERTAAKQRQAVRAALEYGYRAAMQYAERVAGEPILLDSTQIDRVWQRYETETDDR